jgi:hypothetical protein
MITREQAIPYLLSRLEDECGLAKTASIVDAILGAPVGAVAARLVAEEENKDQATREGLIIGALLGFLAGQQAVTSAVKEEPLPVQGHPLLMAALGGAGLSAVRHR